MYHPIDIPLLIFETEHIPVLANSMSDNKKVYTQVSGTVKSIVRLVNGSNIVTLSNGFVGYCSDLILKSALKAARYDDDNVHLRALSASGNQVLLGYESNVAGSTYLDKDGNTQTRKQDSNSIGYINIEELLAENVENTTSMKGAIANAVGKNLAELFGKQFSEGNAPVSSLLRKSNEPIAAVEPETETAEPTPVVVGKAEKVVAANATP